MTFEEAIQKLIEAGAHLIPVCKDKKPFKGVKWKDKPWDGKKIKGEMPPHVGFVPASLGFSVIDIDIPEGKNCKSFEDRRKAVNDALGSGLFNIDTPSGGEHVYYSVKDAKSIGNKPLHDIGDLRAGAGYVVLWGNAIQELLSVLDDKQILKDETKEKSLFLKGLDKFSQDNKVTGKNKWDPDSKQRNNSLYTEALAIVINDPEPKKALEQLTKKAEKSGLPEDEIKRTIESALKIGMPKRKEPIKSHLALANRFVKEFGKDYMCILDKNDKPTWWKWDGKIWLLVRTSVVVNDIVDFSEVVCKQKNTLGNRPFAQQAAYIVMGRPDILVDESTLNKDPNLFAMADGSVLDLNNFKCRPQTRKDRITLTAGTTVPYKIRVNPKKGYTYSWIKWTEIQIPDNHRRDYSHRFSGYTLYGHNNLQKALALIGPTSSGKSTFLKMLERFHGDYFFPMAGHVLVKEEGRRYNKGNTEDYYKHMMHNIRLASIVEWDEGSILNADLFSSLVGGDIIAARGCAKDPRKLVPKFKLILVANHAPLGLTSPVLRKLGIIHMEQSYEGKEDQRWEEHFKSEEGKAEYQEWILDGAKKVAKKGLNDHPKHPNLDIFKDPRVKKLNEKLNILVEARILLRGGVIKKDKLARIAFRVSPDQADYIQIAHNLTGVREVVHKELGPTKWLNGQEYYEGYSTGPNYTEGMEKQIPRPFSLVDG